MEASNGLMRPEHAEEFTDGVTLQQPPRLTDAERFVREVAERGCRVIHGSTPRGTSCLGVMRSARAHRDHGTQPEYGPRWGSEGSTGQWRDRVANGERLCRGCRAQLVLEGEYVIPDPEWPYAA